MQDFGGFVHFDSNHLRLWAVSLLIWFEAISGKNKSTMERLVDWMEFPCLRCWRQELWVVFNVGLLNNKGGLTKKTCTKDLVGTFVDLYLSFAFNATNEMMLSGSVRMI